MTTNSERNRSTLFGHRDCDVERCPNACQHEQMAGSSKAACSHSRMALDNPWGRQALPHPFCKTSLIAYVRSSEEPGDAERQIEIIDAFCANHGFKLKNVFRDQGRPSVGLTRALEALNGADGLIAVDLDRFVEHEGDKTRDLRPLVHEFLSLGSKHLITIKEGIDTGSAGGQTPAIEIINQPRNHGLDLS